MNNIDVTIFLSLCFFTMGILGVIGIMSLYLNYYFRLRVYRFHLAYIIVTLSFVTAVFVVQSKLFSSDLIIYKAFYLLYDILQVLIFFLHTSFIYQSMVAENSKFKKLSGLMKMYTIFTISFVLFCLLFPLLNDDGIKKGSTVFIVSRLIIMLFSLPIFFYLIRSLQIVYFRYLTLASSLFLFFGCLAVWDATANRGFSVFKGFQFICMGYVLENLCFSAGFVYRIIAAYKENKSAELNHEMQLGLVQLESQQETMKNIGVEIHDNVGQKLTLASLYTQQLAFENTAPQITGKITNVGSIINESLAELRQLSKSLTSDRITGNSIQILLRQEREKLKGIVNCEVFYNEADSANELNYQVKTILLRIVQEFIQNSIKHSKCNNIIIRLAVTPLKINLNLSDDGIGFQVGKLSGNGIGLRNIKDRVKLLVGEFKLTSAPSTGTELNIIIPV